MIKALICCGLGLFGMLAAKAQTYPVSDIPDSLKSRATYVIRDWTLDFTVQTPARGILKEHKVITVMNVRGKASANFSAYSYTFEKLTAAHIKIYDASGKLWKEVKLKDMETSGYGGNLVDDGQMTYYMTSAPTYPYTVDMESTSEYKGLIAYPSLNLGHTESSIQHMNYTIHIPASVGLRYKAHDIDLEPRISDDPSNAGTKMYTWEVKDIRARRAQTNMISDKVPGVWIAPEHFSMGDADGDMSTWQQFGLWVYNLNTDRWTLPESSKLFYRQLVAGAGTDKAKARILYAYLQKNFRYVSIQLGIGGFKAFPSAYTEKNKYGDCKGLSSYMKACLDAVGIKSYVALINGGWGLTPVDPGFPRQSFNHAILCIPFTGDTTWLECTSKVNDFGVLTGFTEDRNALLLTEKGGVLVSTPHSRAEENSSATYSKVTLAEDGSGTDELVQRARGAYKINKLNALQDADQETKKQYLINSMDYPEPDSFSLRLDQRGHSTLDLTLVGHLRFEKIPDAAAGNLMFLFPRISPVSEYRLPPALTRADDYHFSYPFELSDTTAYQLPDGYAVEHLPPGKDQQTKEVFYHTQYWYDTASHVVYSVIHLKLSDKDIPLADYAGVRSIFATAADERKERIIIRKS